jgi:nucleotide-binding universal stress UspA family protein
MLVDLGVLLESAEIHWIIGVLLIVALLTKYLAAYITQKVFGFNLKERNLIFGLTTARAASAIAIIIVGFNLGMVHETTMNATIILVLITSLISSFVTERSGKQLAVQKEKKEIPAREEERILIPISNPSTIEKLISFAVIIKNDKSDQPIFPINIVEDDQEATEKISEYTEMLESAKEHAAATDHIAKIITRVDTNVADGISRAIKELAINKVVIGWHDKTPTKDFFFGSLLNNLLEKTGKAVYVSRINSAVNLINKIHVLMPPNTEYEKGFYEWISDICDICGHTDSQMVFWGYENTHEKIKQYMNKQNKEFDVVYRHAKCVEMLKIISKKLAREDLLVIVKARKHTLSYNKEIAQIPEKIDQHFTDTNIVVVYPEQEIIYRDAMDVQV